MLTFIANWLRKIYCKFLCVLYWFCGIIKNFLCLDCCSDVGGTIVFSTGDHEIVVETNSDPKEVYLSTSEPCDSIPTCAGDLNWTAARIIPGGFIINAKIKSNSCIVKYLLR